MKKFLLDVIFAKLDEYEGIKTNIYDLAYTLLETYNCDGTYTYSTQESIDLIKKYWDDITDLFYDDIIEMNYNPFTESEHFLVYVMMEYAYHLISNIEMSEEEFILDEKHINYIKKELSE